MKPLDNCVEDSPITLPVLKHGVTRIGDLWDCHTSTNVGENLFTENLDGKYVRASPIESVDYKLIHSRSISDEMKTVKISGEVSLELLGGLIAVKGGADYKNDEKKSAKSEKLICYYERETYSIFAEHTAKNVVNQDILEKIMNKEIKATHFVRSVVLGGELRADIEISTNDKKSFSDINGNLFGKLTFGPVSASVRVSLGFLDSSDNSDLKKEITIHSKPAVKIQPTSIEQMFTMVDSFSDVVQGETHFSESGKNVVGVPIKFILVPIKVFFTFNVERLYIKMKENAMNQFKDMLEKIHDYQSPDYISRLVLDKIPELSIILNDELSKLSILIRNYEKGLIEICKEYFEKSTNAFRDYKVGKITIEDLLSIRNEFDTKCNSNDIYEKIISFGKDGEEQIRSIHSVDIQDSKHFLSILTNENQLNNFIIGDKEIKILLCTDHASPEDVFLKFYEMAKPLKSLGCRLAVAIQEISPKFQLIVKTRGNEQIYDDKSMIPSILSIIAATVEIGSDNELLFHSVNAEILNTKLPYRTEKELKDINNFILNSRVKKSKALTIAKSTQETFECLTRMDDNLKFFIPIDIVITSFLAIRNLPVLLSEIQSENINWIVGNLNVDQEEESALLFLIKNGKVLAVCLDIFDLTYLRGNFDEGNLETLFLLSPKELSFSFYPKRVEGTLKIIKIIESYEHKLITISSIGMKSFRKPDNDNDTEVSNCLQLVTALNSKLSFNFHGILAKLALREHEELEKSLVNVGFSPTSARFTNDSLSAESKIKIIQEVKSITQDSNPFVAKINLTLTVLNEYINEKEKDYYKNKDLTNAVNNAIDSLLNDLNCPENLKNGIKNLEAIDLKIKCNQIIRLLENYQNPNPKDQKFHLKSFLSILQNDQEENVHNVMLSYINRINVDFNVFGSVNTKLIEKLKKKHYFTMMMYLSEISKGIKYYIIQKGLENICGSADKDKIYAMDQLLTKLSDPKYFCKEQWEDLWNNTRFLFLIRSYIDQHRIASKLLQMGSADYIPNYIPKDIAAKIDATRIVSNNISLPDIIKDFEHFLIILKELRRASDIPDKFKTILAQSITANPELMKKLNEFSITSKWKWNGNIFSESIEMSSIENIVDEINNSSRELNEMQIAHRLPEINFTIQFDDHIDWENYEVELADWPMPVEILNIFGKKAQKVKYEEFITLKKILSRPTIDPTRKPIASQIIPYLIQKIKMWGCSELKTENIYLMMTKRSYGDKTLTITNRPKFQSAGRNRNIDEEKKKEEILLSRLDAIVAIFNNSDLFVGQKMLTVMTKFPTAIPLIIREINQEDQYKVLIPWLTESTIKWESSQGNIIENNLFTDKFKMIVALRIGDVRQGKLGKSMILNQLFSLKNVFSSNGESGSKGNKPTTLKGTAEMILLTKEIASDPLWESSLAEHYRSGENELVLLVNLHGNALELPDHLSFFKKIATAYVLFVMSDGISDLAADFDQIEQMLSLDPGSSKLGYVAIDPIEARLHDDENIIDTSIIHDNLNLAKLRTILKTAIRHVRQECNIKYLNDIGIVKMAEYIETELSNKLINFIQKASCQKVKNNLCIQRATGDDILLESFLIWKDNDFLHQLITMMGNILKLDIDSRQKAIIHLDRQLGIISAKESEAVRFDYKDAILEYQKCISKEDEGNDKVALNYWKERINDKLEKIDNMSLGLEHFFRKFGKLYEMSLRTNSPMNSYSDLAKSYAELLISGHPIELLDGDSNSIINSWFTAICSNVNAILPKLKIFVISILGLQSSGKSTLLNSLFGCKFPASVLRCTKGLFMNLVFLDKEMKEKLDLSFDAVLLIDSEGLGAIEKQNEEKSKLKDRMKMMAAFAMGISHLTIINILGDNTKNLAEILQIAFISMARQEKVVISSDILVVQHLNGRNGDKMASARKKFSDALEIAIDIATQKDMSLGIQNSNCLKKLSKTIERGKLFCKIRPFKNGSIHSSPSDEYHTDVVKLYESIFEFAQSSGANFEDWTQMVPNYWKSIKEETYTRFKDVKDLEEFLKITDKVFSVKDAIGRAFKEHNEKMTCYLSKPDTEINKIEAKEEKAKNHLEDFYRIPSPCPDEHPCDHCLNFHKVEGQLLLEVYEKPYEYDVISSIENYIKNLRDDYIRNYSQKHHSVAFRQMFSVGNSNKIESLLDKKFAKITNISEIGIQAIAEEFWNELERKASEKVKEFPVMNRMMSELKQVYDDSPQLLNEFITNKCISLENLPAYNLTLNKKIKYSTNKQVGAFLKPAQIFKLEGILNSLPSEIMKKEKADTYRKGMVEKLSLEINKILNKFTSQVNSHLRNSFKWKVVNFAINAFLKYMVEQQRKWDLRNNPLIIMQTNYANYYKCISDIQQKGAVFYTQGIQTGIDLLRAIFQKAKKSVNDIFNKINDVDWTKSPSSIKLKYLSELVVEIKQNELKNALEFFNAPQQVLTKWFENKIPSGSSVDKYILVFEENVKEVFNKVSSQMSELSTIEEKQDYIDKFIFDCTGNNAMFNTIGSSATIADSKMFSAGIFKTFVEEKGRMCDTNEIKHEFLAWNSEKTKMLGCMEMCDFCSALCFMHYGHESNKGESKKHNTYHQPFGLQTKITYYKNNNELMFEPCHNIIDKNLWWNVLSNSVEISVDFKSMIAENGIPDVWKFEAHPDLTELMRWVFFKLHTEIAKRYGVDWSKESEKHQYDIIKLDKKIDSILSNIQMFT